jgi:hypothetical protein
MTSFYVGDTAERQIGESARGVKSARIQGFGVCRFCIGLSSRQKRRACCRERTVQKVSAFHWLSPI